ncbi:MAG: hypothetical protein MH204_03100 [Fimbriimonadaceae bacterium]|nr:hypothetical protein [Fimbriimonadaceae bacterium]
MKGHRLLTWLGLGCLGIGVAVALQPVHRGEPAILILQDSAVLVREPEILLDSATQWAWSRSGRTLAAVRLDIRISDPVQALDPDRIMEAARGTSAEIWAFPTKGPGRRMTRLPQGFAVGWLAWADQDRLLVVSGAMLGSGGPEQPTTLAIHAQTGVQVPIPSQYRIMDPDGAVFWTTDEAVLWRITGAGGSPTAQALGRVPEALAGRRLSAATKSGRLVFMSDTPTPLPPLGWDLRTGRVEPVDRSEIDFGSADTSPDEAGSLRLVRAKEGVLLGGSGPSEPVLLSRDAVKASVAPDGSAAVFLAHGTLYRNLIQPIPLSLAKKTKSELEKAKIMARLKMVGTGLHIYAADYDDFFPTDGSMVREAIMPYLRDAALLEGVVFTNLTGQNVARLKDPAQTALAYISGPDGRAVLYADGSVRWEGPASP